MAASTWKSDIPMKSTMFFENCLIFLFICSVSCINEAVDVARPRGVALTKKPFYNPANDFTCLDGSVTIPFDYVNDDYCDCPDGTDEPGTAACPNGIFHCTNAGHRPLNIPSSRVNDGICDCCDASDEYNSTAACVNHCKELGLKAREEAQRQLEMITKGYELRMELGKQGQQKKEERKTKLAELEKELEVASTVKAEKEATKTAAEEPEKAALEKYKVEEEEKKKLEDNEKAEQDREEEAIQAFEDLDVNKDGKVTIAEVQERWVFDQNKDGTVSPEEAKFFLLNKEEMDLEEFKTTGWILMKPHYSLQKMFKPPAEELPESQTEEPSKEGGGEEEDDEELYPEENQGEEELDREPNDGVEEEDDSDLVEPPKFPPQEPTEKPAEETQYDEETKQLIEIATQARNEFEEAERKVKDLEDSIRLIKEKLEIDFGPNDEFGPMEGQCIEYSDREYVYKLCPFDQASQKPKSGGSETNLGRWGSWTGPESNKYSKMKYENGLTCWNGPARSTEVRLSCGMENKITFVSEPNRCEYVFDLTTPALCNQQPKPGTDPHTHEEL